MEPASSDMSDSTMINARASIDFALDLERQLDALHEDEVLKEMQDEATPDPEVLTSIVIQLRHNLELITLERDELIVALGQSQITSGNLDARVTDLTEQVESERQRAAAAEAKLKEMQVKVQEDEEQINMLRAKVEESRKGIMRLQAESNRRMSGQFSTGPLALDLTASRSAGYPAPLASAKRATFAPSNLALNKRGSIHRRISSLSEPGISLQLTDSTEPNGTLPSPSPRRMEFAAENPDSPPSKRSSLILRRDDVVAPSTSPPRATLHPSAAELESLRAELVSLKHRLREANDAREASETCLKVLREFMAHQHAQMENDDGVDPSLKGLRLPPLPTDTIADEEEEPPINVPKPEPETKKAGGWGLRLWKDTPAPAVPAPAPATSQPSTTLTRSSSSSSVHDQRPASTRSDNGESPSLTSFVSGWAKSSCSAGGSDKDASSIRSASEASSPLATHPQSQSQPAAQTLGGALRKFTLFSKSAPPPALTPPSAAISHSNNTSPDFRGDVLSIGSSNTSSESSGPASPTDDAHVMLPLNLDIELGNKTPTFPPHEPVVAV